MRFLSMLILALLIGSTAAEVRGEEPTQSPLQAAPAAPKVYPRIVLFSTSWCPHCKRAKEYFTSNNIPFINRDVEVDGEAMQLLTEKYKSQAVPVIVIGDDVVILRGFNEQKFEEAVKKGIK